jgi:hypothetical protein
VINPIIKGGVNEFKVIKQFKIELIDYNGRKMVRVTKWQDGVGGKGSIMSLEQFKNAMEFDY